MVDLGGSCQRSLEDALLRWNRLCLRVLYLGQGTMGVEVPGPLQRMTGKVCWRKEQAGKREDMSSLAGNCRFGPPEGHDNYWSKSVIGTMERRCSSTLLLRPQRED